MKEVVISSSVLIAALLLLRAVFRQTVSRRVQYALWGLVLVRLLLPVSLPGLHVSVLTAAEPLQTMVSAQLDKQAVYVPIARQPLSQYPSAPDLRPELAMPPNASSVWVVGDDETAVQYRRLTGTELAQLVWYAGMAGVAICFLVTNFCFWRKVRKARVPYSVPDCKHPVYLCEGLPSPCLFGLFRPAIYLTPAAVGNAAALRHVIAHEEAHARHLDSLWSLLRCVCLSIYWFHPLVWASALASKTDCELACDEGALRRLDAGERLAYGQTLLQLIPVRHRKVNPLLSATTMTSGKRQLTDRITRIAENRQTVAAALFAVVAVAAVVCAVTFTGAETSPNPPSAQNLFLPPAQPDAVSSLEKRQTVEVSVAAQAVPAEDIQLLTEPVPVGEFEVFAYRSGSGDAFLAYRPLTGEERTVFWFQKLEASSVDAIEPAENLLGYDGFSVRLLLPDGTPGQSACFCFDDSGALLPLASFTDGYTITDFNGDGVSELLFSYSGVYGTALLYRDGDGLYAVDLEALTQQAYPDSDRYISFGIYDSKTHSLPLSLYVANDNTEWMSAFRWMFFDGTQLLFYKDWRTTEGHVAGDLSHLPADVVAAAKSQVETYYGEALSSEWLSPAAYDDWRIESLTFAQTYPNFHSMEIEVYQMNYELHAAAPENVTLAGGMYLTEDGWVMPSYPNCTYLFFSVENGQRTYLYDAMFNDGGVDSPLFLSDMEHYFFQNPGLLPSFEGYAEPVEHTEEEYQAAVATVQEHLTQRSQHPNVVSLDVHSLSVSQTETARVVKLYTGSPLAEAQSLSAPYLRQMIAVEAVYTIEWLPSVNADEDGLTARFFYLLPEEDAPGSWYIWDSMGAPLMADDVANAAE